MSETHSKPDRSSRAPQSSWVSLPARNPTPLLLDFLCERFPRINRATWSHRLADGKVLDEQGLPLSLESPYRARSRIQYFREVESEPRVPFQEEILLQTEDLLVADKPHFLPVVPAGKYVNECLLYRLRARTGLQELAPLHRLDLDTAGLVLFSTRRETRGAYGLLFERGTIERDYLAVGQATSGEAPARSAWTLESRIEPGDPWFTSVSRLSADPNARTEISLLCWDETRAQGLFHLRPHTGKNHQLRLHMASLGFPIVHDRLYPDLQPEGSRNWSEPMQLLAQKLAFTDPVTGERRDLESEQRLALAPRTDLI